MRPLVALLALGLTLAAGPSPAQPVDEDPLAQPEPAEPEDSVAESVSTEAEDPVDEPDGVPARNGEGVPVVIPWQAQIYSGATDWAPKQLAIREGWDLAHKCGGTLIAPDWVLTAAHCINAERVKNGHRVRLGASAINSDDGITYRIDRMVRHADYDKPRHIYDIALVHFVADDRTVQGHAGEIEPIELYDGPPLEPGVSLFASGWGKLEATAKGYSADLSEVDLQTVDCTEYPKPARWAAEYHLCAAGLTPDDDTCEGDSGGPLVMAGDTTLLVGVVNFGFGCYQEDSAGVYIRIDHDHFRDWIARAMAADPSVSEMR
jgi:V8-like Glu-specific endopeptidase